MSMGKGIGVLIIAALLLPLASHAATVSCSDAVNALIPCGQFLTGGGSNIPSPQCCQSAQSLNKLATTVATRRQLCECLKTTGPSFGVKPARARLLPSACKLKLNIPISPNVDCSTV